MRESATKTWGGLLTGPRVAVAAAFVILPCAAWLVPPSLLETFLARITPTRSVPVSRSHDSAETSRTSQQVARAAQSPRPREAAAPAFAAGHSGPRVEELAATEGNLDVLAGSANRDAYAKEADPGSLALSAPEVPSSTPPRIYSALDVDVTPPSPFRTQRLGNLARGSDTNDEVTIEVVIDASGAVEGARASKSPRTLAESLLLTTALHAVKTWQFKPAVKDSIAVPYRQVIGVRESFKTAEPPTGS